MDTTRDTTSHIRVGELDRDNRTVELSGEFDVRDLERLRKALGDASEPGLPTTVDLSGVTFLDLGCTRELAVQARLRAYLALCNPSWQVEASFRACEIGSYPNREHLCPTKAPKGAEETPCRTSALAV